jgi:hypothetical protein
MYEQKKYGGTGASGAKYDAFMSCLLAETLI